MDIQKMKKDYRTKKSHAFTFVKPTSMGKRLYYQGREDYKEALMKLLIATADTLKALGVSVKIVVSQEDKKAA